MRSVILALALSVSASCQPAFAGDLPDQAMTPGALNPAITQDNIAATICARPTVKPNGRKVGWTATVRPSAAFTDALKAKQMEALGLHGDPHLWEEDHRVPLECGGAPRDPRNLWPQPWHGARNAHQKDRLENREKHDVCAGRITLAQCQAVFLGDFWAEYDRLFPATAARAK
jgi:hypothetical protein